MSSSRQQNFESHIEFYARQNNKRTFENHDDMSFKRQKFSDNGDDSYSMSVTKPSYESISERRSSGINYEPTHSEIPADFSSVSKNSNKVRRLSIDDNVVHETSTTSPCTLNQSSNASSQLPPRPMSEVPAAELPSCSYSNRNINSFMMNSSNYALNTKEDELFASSARANTPPLPQSQTPDVFPTDLRKTDCLGVPEEIKASKDCQVSDQACQEKQPASSEPRESNSTQHLPSKELINESSNEDTKLNNDNDTDEKAATENFLKLLQPVLSTLLSAPEAMHLRSKLENPDKLLLEMVNKWGGEPSKSKNPLERMKQNFEVFLKRFITPEDYNEWGWEGRSVEEILHLLNSEKGKYMLYYSIS